jgi:Ca2+-binding EF-hand superfamily protein
VSVWQNFMTSTIRHLAITDKIEKLKNCICKPDKIIILLDRYSKFCKNRAEFLNFNVHPLLIIFLKFSAKDENIRRMINEIENLTEDSNKLQQILDLVSTLRCPHQTLEESIRDTQLNIQRQLSERQSNDSQLNILELNVNEP